MFGLVSSPPMTEIEAETPGQTTPRPRLRSPIVKRPESQIEVIGHEIEGLLVLIQLAC